MRLRTATLLLAGASLSVFVGADSLTDLIHYSGIHNLSLGAISESMSGANPWDNTYPSTPTPWNISIDANFIAFTKLKLALTRYHHDLEDQEAWLEGPPRQNVSQIHDYWLNDFDWFEAEDELNGYYKHFRTTVTTGPGSNYTRDVPLHYVHHRSPRKDAIPFLYFHGEPGCFLEIKDILSDLTHPPAGQPAFHVVVPSLPGWGFSPAPEVVGMGPAHIGDAMAELMKQLDYPHYVLQAGDYGATISRYMAAAHPDAVLSILSNFWEVSPNATDLERYANGTTTPDEDTIIKNIENYENNFSGYRLMMATTPKQVVVAMTDSPMGNLMFNYQIQWLDAKGYEWPLRTTVLWSMMYWLQGPYGAQRHYRQMADAGIYAGFTLKNNWPYVKQPVALTEYPGDLWFGTPLDWAQRFGNVVKRTVHTTGGHFPSVQTPDLFMQDIRGFFGDGKLANTSMFLDA